MNERAQWSARAMRAAWIKQTSERWEVRAEEKVDERVAHYKRPDFEMPWITVKE